MSSPFSALRRFVTPRVPAHRCELCGKELPPEHAHLLELARQSGDRVALVGSVSNQVVHHAPRPVVVVRSRH